MSILTYVFVWVFVMHNFVRMTINILMGFRHVHVCTNDYPFPCAWVFVMHISVQMTIHLFWIGFRHAHFCTNDYHFFFEWIVVMHISVQMTTISFWRDCRHAHFCTNDYHIFLNGFSSWTFLYEWLPFRCILVLVMHILCKWLSIFFVYGFSPCTFLCEWLSIFFWVFHVCNSLQVSNSMVQWRIKNDIIIYIGFDHVCNALQRVNSMVQLNKLRTISSCI